MSQFKTNDTVASVVVRYPALWNVLEDAGIDYCCGGKKSLGEACRDNGIDAEAFLRQLTESAQMDAPESVIDPVALSLTELAEHIEQTHHVYLRAELPRLRDISTRVVNAHGAKDARLQTVKDTVFQLSQELDAHMLKEERILFPLIRQLEAQDPQADWPAGSIANPIRQMELEHEQAGAALDVFRAQTDDFHFPEWGCNTYRALLTGLQQLETDLHQHIHKENNVLFPRAIAMELERTA